MKVINLIDPNGRISIMYSIEKSEGDSLVQTKLERLKTTSQDLGEKSRRSFYVDASKDKELVVLSIMKNQVFVNLATIVDGVLKLASVSTKIDFVKTLFKETIEVYYTPTAERKIFVIDVETGDEVEPEFNITSTGETKGIISLKAEKKYLVIEIREAAFRSILVGLCQLYIEDDMLKLNINKAEAKRVRVDKYVELINSGKCIEQKLTEVSTEKER